MFGAFLPGVFVARDSSFRSQKMLEYVMLLTCLLSGGAPNDVPGNSPATILLLRSPDGVCRAPLACLSGSALSVDVQLKNLLTRPYLPYLYPNSGKTALFPSKETLSQSDM